MTFQEGYVAPQLPKPCPCDELKRVRDKVDSHQQQIASTENGTALLQMQMQNLEVNVQKDIEALRAEMKTELAGVRSDISEIKELLQSHIKEESNDIKKKLSDWSTVVRDFLISVVLLYIAWKIGVK